VWSIRPKFLMRTDRSAATEHHLGGNYQVLTTIDAERATFLAVGCLVAEPGLLALGDEFRAQG
jgi:hypothetical protein